MGDAIDFWKRTMTTNTNTDADGHDSDKKRKLPLAGELQEEEEEVERESEAHAEVERDGETPVQMSKLVIAKYEHELVLLKEWRESCNKRLDSFEEHARTVIAIMQQQQQQK